VAHSFEMKLAAEVLLLVFMIGSLVVVLAFFVWGARKDGEDDRAMQERLGIKRRTRLGG